MEERKTARLCEHVPRFLDVLQFIWAGHVPKPLGQEALIKIPGERLGTINQSASPADHHLPLNVRRRLARIAHPPCQPHLSIKSLPPLIPTAAVAGTGPGHNAINGRHAIHQSAAGFNI